MESRARPENQGVYVTVQVIFFLEHSDSRAELKRPYHQGGERDCYSVIFCRYTL